MDKTADNERHRAKWLGTLKEVVEGAFEIEAELGRLCPSLGGKTLKDRNDAMRVISRLSKDNSGHIKRMSRLETNEFGFRMGLGFDPYGNQTLITCLALLLAARLEPGVARQVYAVGDLETLAARRDPVTALAIRSFFRADGVLHPLVTLGRALTLDETLVRMRESVFNRITGQDTDRTETVCEAESIAGRIRG